MQRTITVNTTQGERKLSCAAELPGGWLAVMEWDDDAPVGGPHTLTIRPDQDRVEEWAGTAGVTTELLRTVPVREMTAALNATVRHLDGFATIAARSDTSRVGRAGRSDRFYAELAADYAAIAAQGVRHPAATLARVQEASPDTINTRLKEARRRGLLTGPKDEPANALTAHGQGELSRATNAEGAEIASGSLGTPARER